MKIYPVIHFLDRETTIDQVAIARRAGATGVFLISHLGNDNELVNVAWEIKQANQGFPIGINLLSKSAIIATEKALEADLDMVWADDMGVDSNGLSTSGEYISRFAEINPQVRFFASVAFKYRPVDPLPALAAEKALHAGFIPTTSGAATGLPPSVKRIATMSKAVGGTLAVASGMTPENVASFAPYLSHILVATGISIDEHHIDEAKLRGLIANASAGIATRSTC